MRFRTVTLDGRRCTVAVRDEETYAVLDAGRSVDESLATGTLASSLGQGGLPELNRFKTVPMTAVERIQSLVYRPRKLWGIGLNYREHAGDLDETAPTEPASFLKADHTLIGADDAIVIPRGSTRTTSEAELGIVIGRTAYQVDRSEALSYIAGICLILDQTEEEILRRNPRYLTRSKNFPTFLSVGPDLVTLDEALAGVGGDINRLEVQTKLDGELIRSNTVGNMTFPPDDLISFHSQLMPLYPGDVISTGTPGAVVIAPGHIAECHIAGIGSLTNPVLGWDDPRAIEQLAAITH